MTKLHLPFLELAVAIPVVGALCLTRVKDAWVARRWCVVFAAAALACTVGAWLDFAWLGTSLASDRWDLTTRLWGKPIFSIDELSAPLLPTVAALYLLTILATPRVKKGRFSFPQSLLSEAICLATFSSYAPWAVVAFLVLGVIPPWLELRSREKPTRIYLLHMLAFVGLLLIGWSFAASGGEGQIHSWSAIVPLLGAVLIRSGMVPFHCWMTDLFEKASFGAALLYLAPLTGALAIVRLVLPIAPDWVLRGIGLVSLVTVVYAAGMALVQREARRLFCYVFLSHSALVFVGLEVVNSIGLTGALCVWLSVCLSLGGFGLTLRAIETRMGRLSLADFHGLYEHTPLLAVCFALTGLASVGFPGTIGFVGTEMLVEGAVDAYPQVGITLLIASAMNGIALVRAYFIIFTGSRHASTVSLSVGLRERVAVVTLATLILVGGFFPQPGVASRHHAAEAILAERHRLHLDEKETEIEPEPGLVDDSVAPQKTHATP